MSKERADNKHAIDVAKDITVAAMSHLDGSINAGKGGSVADFFEAIYKRVSKLESDADAE